MDVRIPPRPILAALAVAMLLGQAAGVLLSGCSSPTARLERVRVGMTKGDVRKIMGNPLRERWDPGVEGIEGGKTAWIYEGGEVRFFMQEVEKVLTTEELEKEKLAKKESEKKPAPKSRRGEPDKPYSFFGN